MPRCLCPASTCHIHVSVTSLGSAHVDSMDDIYAKKFGVRPVINCIGTMTALGGSRMDPSVVARASPAGKRT